MDILMHPLFVMAISALLTAAGCAWWYGRKLRACASSIKRLKAENHHVDEQLKEAKRQVSTLKTTLIAEQAKAAAKPAPAVQAKPAVAAPPASTSARPWYLDMGDDEHVEPAQPAHGFADTMPFTQGA